MGFASRQNVAVAASLAALVIAAQLRSEPMKMGG